MSADQLLQQLSNALFVLIFVLVGVRAIQRPSAAAIDTALLFGAIAVVVLITWIDGVLRITPPRWVVALTASLAMALPYLLLRLVDDFAGVTSWILRLAEVGLALAVIAVVLLPTTSPLLLVPLVAYFAIVTAYSAARFVRHAAMSRGVTRRRMQSVALGSACLGLAIVLASLNTLVPPFAPIGLLLVRIAGLCSGVGFYLGFAPPTWLRRAWQAPELREFLGRAASLPRLPDTHSIVRELGRGAATSMGAQAANVGLWDASAGVLRFWPIEATNEAPAAEVDEGPPSARFVRRGMTWEVGSTNPVSGRALIAQQPVYAADVLREDPLNADLYARFGVRSLLAAPITAGDQHLGVLVVYARRPSIFSDSDLELVRLLADQAAVILESRALIDQATRVQAREEATRLKDDFLSAAAHDLKTPLTTIVAQAQLLDRRAELRPTEPLDRKGIQRIIEEARRLSSLVLELLDAARVEQGRMLGRRVPTDLVVLARAACARADSDRHPCTVVGDTTLIGEVDAGRIEQMLANLVENAVKYSPDGGEIRVRVRHQDQEAHIAVTDRGIGIPLTDQKHVFDRFHRASNVDDRRFAGMGLGLYICRGIVEEHGGRIRVESTPGGGSTFYITLPLRQTVGAP